MLFFCCFFVKSEYPHIFKYDLFWCMITEKRMYRWCAKLGTGLMKNFAYRKKKKKNSKAKSLKVYLLEQHLRWRQGNEPHEVSLIGFSKYTPQFSLHVENIDNAPSHFLKNLVLDKLIVLLWVACWLFPYCVICPLWCMPTRERKQIFF